MIRDIILVCGGTIFGYAVSALGILPGLGKVLNTIVMWIKQLFTKG